MYELLSHSLNRKNKKKLIVVSETEDKIKILIYIDIKKFFILFFNSFCWNDATNYNGNNVKLISNYYKN